MQEGAAVINHITVSDIGNIGYVSEAGRQEAAAKVHQTQLALSGQTISADQAPDVQGHQTEGQESENEKNVRAGFQLNAQSTVCKYCLLELQRVKLIKIFFALNVILVLYCVIVINYAQPAGE